MPRFLKFFVSKFFFVDFERCNKRRFCEIYSPRPQTCHENHGSGKNKNRIKFIIIHQFIQTFIQLFFIFSFFIYLIFFFLIFIFFNYHLLFNIFIHLFIYRIMFNSKLLNYSSTYSFIDVYLIHFSFLIWLFYIIFNNLLNHIFYFASYLFVKNKFILIFRFRFCWFSCRIWSSF